MRQIALSWKTKITTIQQSHFLAGQGISDDVLVGRKRWVHEASTVTHRFRLTLLSSNLNNQAVYIITELCLYSFVRIVSLYFNVLIYYLFILFVKYQQTFLRGALCTYLTVYSSGILLIFFYAMYLWLDFIINLFWFVVRSLCIHNYNLLT